MCVGLYEYVLPVQVRSNQRWAEIGGGLGQSKGEDGFLQTLDGGDVAFGC